MLARNITLFYTSYFILFSYTLTEVFTQEKNDVISGICYIKWNAHTHAQVQPKSN